MDFWNPVNLSFVNKRQLTVYLDISYLQFLISAVFNRLEHRGLIDAYGV